MRTRAMMAHGRRRSSWRWRRKETVREGARTGCNEGAVWRIGGRGVRRWSPMISLRQAAFAVRVPAARSPDGVRTHAGSAAPSCAFGRARRDRSTRAGGDDPGRMAEILPWCEPAARRDGEPCVRTAGRRPAAVVRCIGSAIVACPPGLWSDDASGGDEVIGRPGVLARRAPSLALTPWRSEDISPNSACMRRRFAAWAP